MAVSPSSIKIDLSRDSLLNDFTKQTLIERYMLPGETSPQHAFARASAAYADDEDHAQRLYEAVSKLWFMYATPILSNGGSERGLPISCFLSAVSDSRSGIFDHWTETGWLSSVGGGVGGYWGFLREAGKETAKGSKSTGMIPFVAAVDRIILSVSQGGTRRGSYAAYLDISHPEIEEFITMRKPTGGDQNRKATNLHNAVNITDEFMEAVTNNTTFNLRSPKDGTVTKTVRARDLWRLLIETRMQTGEPYMVFIDTINRSLPEPQKKLGLKVHQSNLCVAPYTQMLTRIGHLPIEGLVDQTVDIWNGDDFVPVTIRKTADEAELVRVWFEDGDYVDCTPQHKFHLFDGTIVQAGELENGSTLWGARTGIANEWKKFQLDEDPHHAMAIAFTAGWATFAGFEDSNRLAVYAPAALPDSELKQLLTASVNSEQDEAGMMIRYEPRDIPAGRLPLTWSVSERREWLRGIIMASGTKMRLDDSDAELLCIGSNDVDLIRGIRLIALELGLSPVIRLTDTMNALTLTQEDFDALVDGIHPSPIHHAVVCDVQPLPFRLETYCATEPKTGRLTFNGYITGNCTEITLPTGVDKFDKMRTAVCCLSSVNAEKFDEWRYDPQFLEDLFRMLDNALNAFISDAPPELHNAVYSAMRERSVGLGVLGFQSYLQAKGFSLESPQARLLNLDLFTYLRAEANRISLKLGEERGEAPDMEGTGERFAHKLAVAPNASSSILCGGTSPSIEPHRANAFLHKTLSGSFPVKNPYLSKALQKLDLDNDATWQSIVANEGSVQHLDIPDDIKVIFKTATELDQMALVQLAADRAPYICQAQSLNLFFEHNADAKEITKAHYKAWEMGVKSLYYLRSTTPSRAENTNKKVERMTMAENFVVEDGSGKQADDCLACQG
jgi:ribonucleoside-diphosphate reductase alpha chain